MTPLATEQGDEGVQWTWTACLWNMRYGENRAISGFAKLWILIFASGFWCGNRSEAYVTSKNFFISNLALLAAFFSTSNKSVIGIRCELMSKMNLDIQKYLRAFLSHEILLCCSKFDIRPVLRAAILHTSQPNIAWFDSGLHSFFPKLSFITETSWDS